MKRSLLRLALAGAGLGLASLSFAEDHPNLTRGFKPDQIYQNLGEVDNVNLWNGNLTITIPIGQRYPVGGNLEYGLTLVWTGNVWDVREREDPGNGTMSRYEPGARYERGGGLGWRLSLGDLQFPDDVDNTNQAYVWVGPDGAEHVFYSQLHPEQQAQTNRAFTRDATYLRLNTEGAEPILEFPDGTIHRFFAKTAGIWERGQVKRIEDRFGNYLALTYAADGSWWKLNDSHGRIHTVNFRTTGSAIYSRVVSSVVLEAFNGASATYTFTSEDKPVARPCAGTLSNPDPENQTPAFVPILTGIFLPDGTYPNSSSYAMPVTSYELGTDPGDTCSPTNGHILALDLPTKGRIQWAYTTVRFPTSSAPMEKPQFLGSNGVEQRTLLGANLAVIGAWTYTHELLPVPSSSTPGPGFNPPREKRTTVLTPLGDKTIHYFSAFREPFGYETWEWSDYGLPFSRERNDGAGRFISSEVFDCAAGGINCQLRRTSYVRYSQDDYDFENNRREESSRTVYHDDGGRFADVDRSDWDKFGHYRRVVTAGNFGAGDVRTSHTEYNPQRLSSWPVTQPWILDIASEDWASEVVGGVAQVAKRTYKVDASTGWVERTRIHRLDSGATSASDVVVESLHDGRGNLDSERYYGGDLQALETGVSVDQLALPQPPQYRIDHKTDFGARRSSVYRNTTTGVPMTFESLDCDIDASTGMAQTCRDTAGVPTTYTYDPMGRPSVVSPQNEARTEYDFTRASSASSLARVSVTRRPNSGGAALTEDIVRFDALGRISLEQQRMPGSSLSTRETRYNALGWRISVSELGNTTKRTLFEEYDPFGRPGRVITSDGHEIHLGHSGVRVVTRAVSVGTTFAASQVEEESSISTEIYDRQGRLRQVLEPANPNRTNTTTTYTYDVAGRLRGVGQVTASGSQQRSFVYDQRGFLLSESHPEKGSSGGGLVSYSGYDARGHASRKVDGPFTLDFAYDPAERLRRVSQPGVGDLKSLTYDSPGVNALGKLVTATRHNYVSIGTTPFTFTAIETHTYGGRGGRLSNRQTQARINGSDIERFTVGWTYDLLGNVSVVDYPRCTGGSCAGLDSARNVTHAYSFGRLASLTGASGSVQTSYANPIAYHANGAIAQISHGNGVALQIGLDPSFMARPASFATLGASRNWVSGAYTYDGAGNVTGIGASRYRYDLVSRLVEASLRVESPTPGLPFADGFETGDMRCWDPGACLSGGSVRSQGFTYDAFGNLTAVAGSPGRAIPVSAATNRLSAPGTSFDAAGNLLSWSGATQKFGPFGEIWQTTNGAEDWLHLYTAGDERLFSFKVVPTGAPRHNRWTLRGLGNETLRQYKHFGETWSVERDYVYRDGSLLAAHTAASAPAHLQFFHLDHLGTPRLVTNAVGGVVAYHVYSPFGEELTPFDQTVERSKFTGHERDLNSPLGAGDDLDYMHARYYNPLVGRFLSVDPINSSKPSAPQTWNRYAYADNNPVKNVDRNGLESSAAIALDQDINALLSGQMSSSQYLASIQTRGWAGLIGGAGGFGVMASTASSFAATTALVQGAGLSVLTAPAVTDPGLQIVVNQLFKAGDRLVGGTANAIRLELAIGGSFANGRLHIQAGLQRLQQLQGFVRGGGLNAADRAAAMRMIGDLRNALDPLLARLGLTADQLRQLLSSNQIKQGTLLLKK